MARQTRIFKDLDLNFTPHPVTGDIVRKFDEEAIKQSIRNLVNTQNYERPFHPEIGSQLRGLLFEPATPLLGVMLKRAIQDTIINFEPRVNLIDVIVTISPDNYEVYVTVAFAIVNTTTPIQLELVLERTR
jgi:phage baseplate assembly protein W